ncbi:LOW QUALITY PROTEIN: uncharacterized protein LOC108089566 [Drosophila ficusphila]|uniref:LOW QUALITY PROTEIN: uncharacterized protein LOC108089566 n=1 Tax=Drosophila ficusphila TaxID=30025 RepID=UPI001C899190|nr:LOW QUALITY PROTEIN: uncharacterized protein LOC108089566 [Drosophila ficusphila]
MASSSSRNFGAHNKPPPPPPCPPRHVIWPRPSMLQFEPHEKRRLSRCRYVALVYLLVVVLLLLALVQWEIISFHKPLSKFFLANCWLSVTCMLISVPLLAVFLILREVRYIPILGWVLLCIIIELMVIGIGTFAAYCDEWHFLMYFAITAILMATSLLIGSFIPCDLTANVAVLFLVGSQMFLVSVYLLMTFMMIESADGFFFPFAALLLAVVCMVRISAFGDSSNPASNSQFAMYHGQLIRGWRYAELYTTDGLFAVIVIFCHFCIILMLFCYLDWSKDKKEEVYGISKNKDEALNKNLQSGNDKFELRTPNTYEEVVNGVIYL